MTNNNPCAQWASSQPNLPDWEEQKLKNQNLSFVRTQYIKAAPRKVLCIRLWGRAPHQSRRREHHRAQEDFLALISLFLCGKWRKCWQQDKANGLSDFWKASHYMQFLMIPNIHLKLTPKANTIVCLMIIKCYNILNIWERHFLHRRWPELLAK